MNTLNQLGRFALSAFSRTPKAQAPAVTPVAKRPHYLDGFGAGYNAGYEAGLRVASTAEKCTLTALLRVIENQPEHAAESVKQLLASISAE